MKADTVKLLFTYLIAVMVLVGTFYALVMYKFELSTLIQGALISWATLVLNNVFNDQVAARTSNQQQKAYDSGLQTPAPNGQNGQTVTATGGANPSVTVEPAPPVPAPGG